MTPSHTALGSDVTLGPTVAVQFEAGPAYQYGVTFADNQSFHEFGVGWPPGANFSQYYVFDPMAALGKLFAEPTNVNDVSFAVAPWSSFVYLPVPGNGPCLTSSP